MFGEDQKLTTRHKGDLARLPHCEFADGGEIDNVELDDLTDSDDELWLICFVLLNDVIYCRSKT